MGDQYGLPDFRQFMVGRTHFPSIAQPTDSFFSQRNIAAAPLHYEPIMVGEVLPRGIVGFGHDSPNSVTPTTATATSSAAAATLCAGSVQMDSGWMGYDVENTRWPRQETLTLLEIRSRLDSKFKQTNQKGPLWDEVSRLMAEEYGYQRSGKKCKEKFENLYKYYKKTKERKIGRQGGKHYRFFRQLEAIYGEASTHTTVSDTHFARNSLPNDQIPHYNVLINQENQEVDHLQTPRLSDQSLSFSNSSEFETSSSENRMNYQSMEKQIGMNKKKWKAKIEDFVDSQMRKIMDTQEVWMDRLLKTIEHREKERVFREEEWRKQEAARFDQEVHHIWTKEREWVEARDAALMEALKKFMGKGLEVSQSAEPMAIENQDENGKEISYNNSRWTELEVSNLIELRTSLELRFQDGGHLDESDLWEEIAAKMGSLGYERSAIEYKEKWQHLSIYYNKAIMECRNKKQKEDLDLRSGSYFHEQYHDYYLGQEISKQRPESMGLQLIINEGTLPPSSSSDRAQADVHRHGFRHEEENLWEKYGVRYYKGKTSN